MTIEVATLSPAFEQSVANELRQLEETQSELQAALAEVDEKIARVEVFKNEHFEPYTAPYVPTPDPATTVKKPAKKTATRVAQSVLKDPPKGGTKARILELLKDGPQSQAGMQQKIGVSSPTMSTSAKQLHAQGAIQTDGKDGRSTIWKLPSKQVGGAKPAEKKTAPPADSGPQQPLLEGRIFSLLQYQRLSIADIARELGADPVDIRQVLNKLTEEGELRLCTPAPNETWEGAGL